MLQVIPHFPCEDSYHKSIVEIEDSKEPDIKSDNKYDEESFKLLKPKYLEALGII